MIIKLSEIVKRVNGDLVNLIEEKISEFYMEFGVKPERILIPETKKEELLKRAFFPHCVISAEATYPLYTLGSREPVLQEAVYYVSEMFGIDVLYTGEESTIGKCELILVNNEHYKYYKL